ncbi:MAG: hypothetical protein CSA29_05165 [Desulfobacterales bacterium]|nr:MAG: hypothetical protein CSA29_05165 [Desulfobacterales bacterium]
MTKKRTHTEKILVGQTGELTTLLALMERLKGQDIAIGELAELLGLAYTPAPKDKETAEPAPVVEPTEIDLNQRLSASDQGPIRPTPYPPDKGFFRFPCLYALEEKGDEDTETIPDTYKRLIPFKEKIEFPQVSEEIMPDPLTEWRVLWPYLRRLGLELKQTSQLDTRKVIQSAVKQAPLTTIPWKKKGVWPLDIVLLLDFSKHLSPFFNDFKQLACHMNQWFRQRLHIVVCADPKTNTFLYREAVHRGFPRTLDPSHLIYAGDLGFLDQQGINAGFWHDFARRQKQKHVRMDALVTAHPSDWIAATARLISLHYWDSGILRPGRAAGYRNTGQRMKSQTQTETLLAALSQAVELTPALIRKVRNHLGLSVSTESLVCRDSALEGNVFRFQWRSKSDREKYINKATARNLDLEAIWPLIEDFECRMVMELRIEQRQKAGKPLETDQKEFLQKLIRFQLNANTPKTEKNRIMAWVGRVAERAGKEIWTPELNTLFGVYNKIVKPKQLPSGVDLTQVPEWAVPSRQTRQIYLSVNQNRLQFFADQEPPHHPGLIHQLSVGSKSQVIFKSDTVTKYPIIMDELFDLPENTSEIVVETNTGRTTVAMMQCPQWASGIGRDQYGVFAEVRVNGCGFILRWIPPGEFMMGSPEDEPERYGDESPLHRVTIEKGFWLAETACTQELWQTVTGENPSEFQEKGGQHPVENVNWDNIVDFIDTLNRLVPGLDVRLPSEAEWEYACRAGTDTPFWFGHELATDKANYNGNHPYNNGPKGKYREETVPVTFFKQNPWGLYQMHGNVWEWCQDRWHDDYHGAPTDGSAWDKGENNKRVCRGGSWFNSGRSLRSASRSYWSPDFRYVYGGLRLARGPLAPEAGRGSNRPGSEPGAARDEQASGIIVPDGGTGEL